jgi:hypothetical protein
VNIVSKQFADSAGLYIENRREWLELADGSQIRTSGTVFGADWSFGSRTDGSSTFRRDFHVLDSLSCDVLLSNELLFDTQAFSAFREHFSDHSIDIYGSDDLLELRLIKLMHKSLKPFLPEVNVDELEHARRAEAEDFISSLPAQDRPAAWMRENQLRTQWYSATRAAESRPFNSHGEATVSPPASNVPSSVFRRLSEFMRNFGQRHRPRESVLPP